MKKAPGREAGRFGYLEREAPAVRISSGPNLQRRNIGQAMFATAEAPILSGVRRDLEPGAVAPFKPPGCKEIAREEACICSGNPAFPFIRAVSTHSGSYPHDLK